MAPKRASSRRKTAPSPIKVSAGRGIGLGIDMRTPAIGSATMVLTPPQSPRKSSLRNHGKTPSPKGKKVSWPTTPESTRVTKTAGATRKTRADSKEVHFSPGTAQRVLEGAKVVQDLVDFTDQVIKSPKAQTTKTRVFRGNKLTGSPVWSPPFSQTKSPTTQAPATRQVGGQQDKTKVSHPSTQIQPNRMGNRMGNSSDIISSTDSAGNSHFHVPKVSEWLYGPSPSEPKIATGVEGEEPVVIGTKAMLDQMQYLKHTKLRPLSLEEIHIQFYLLQKMLRQFSKKFFVTAWEVERTELFKNTFADLAHDQPAFFRMMAYIADGSSFEDGWVNFLSSEHTRPHVVYAILGEWLKYNVFGHSCFGLAPEEDVLMHNIDVRYLNYDGFVRTKERAKLLKKILNNKPRWEQEADMAVAVEKVVAELMVVLAPVLPDCSVMLEQMKDKLSTLIDLAANLHLCIRLTGIDGTILRYHSSTKGDPFAYTARQNCINKSTVKETMREMAAQRTENNKANAKKSRSRQYAEETGPRGADKLHIKMPCFPLVMAVVPYGPTLRDFAVEQSLYGKVVRSEDLPDLNTRGPMYIEDIPAEIVRAACFEELPESCKKSYGERRRKGERKKKAFGSYVRQYILNESDVYCEWEFPEEDGIAGKGMTLRQAVGGAYRMKYPWDIHLRCVKKTAKVVAATTVTATFAGAAIYGSYRAVDGVINHTPLGLAAVAAVKELRLPDSIVPEDLKKAVSQAMAKANARSKPLQQAIKASVGHAWGSVVDVSSLAGSAAKNITSDAYSKAKDFNLTGAVISKAGDLTDSATSMLKEAVLPEETVKPTPTSSMLGRLFHPISVGVRKTPVKVGIKIVKVADPTSRVTKTTKKVMAEQATQVAKTVASRWYEYFVGGGE